MITDPCNLLRQELNSRGLLGDKVGEGQGGTVYKSRDGLVVKVTSDHKEARLATYQLKHCISELPRVEEILAAQVRSREIGAGIRRCYALVREDASDVFVRNTKWFNLLLRLSTGDYREKYLDADELILLKEARAMHSTLRKQFSVGDIAIQNLGRSMRGELVLRDLGSCSFLTETAVEMFDSWNPQQDEWVGNLA